MTTITIDVEEEELCVDGVDYLVNFRVTAEMTYTAAHISGLPEDCYPEDSGCELEEIRVTDCTFLESGEPVTVTKELAAALCEQLDKQDLEDALWEEFFDQEDDDGYDED